jgi:hypothetical protein
MRDKPSTLHDMVAGTLILLALALPFVPTLGDGSARMKVHFRAAEGEAARVFSANTSRRVCSAMAAALSYDNPDTGAFTRVNCAD